MTLEEYMFQIGENEYSEDVRFLLSVIETEDSLKEDIERLLFLFSKGKITKRKLKAEINSLINSFFDYFSHDFEEVLQKSFLDNLLETAFVIQLIKNRFNKVTLGKLNPNWHINKESYIDDMLFYKGRLQQDILKEINRGIIYDQDISVEKAFKTLENSMKAMIDTECSYAERQGTKTAFDNESIKKYRYLATLDTKTCEDCAELDGKVFLVKDAEVGVNYSPMHPHCRCVILPYFEDFETGTRAARDKDGNTIQVPNTMTFAEWNKKYGKTVVNNSKALEKSGKSGKIISEFTIHDDKINKFCLKQGSKHAEEFFNVGYEPSDGELLKHDILTQTTNERVDIKIEDTGAEKFSIFMELGKTKKKRFRTVWQKNTPSSKPRLITAHREDE
jgi:SPP1 gp7 family putative phage head morphogenesis protein